MPRIGQTPNQSLLQQIDQATANGKLSKTEVKGLIKSVKADGVVDASELNIMSDLFQKAAPSVGGLVRPSGATSSETPVKMTNSTAQTFLNFLAEAQMGSTPADVIPDMQQPINPNLTNTTQIPDDVIPDMQQPINPNLANTTQIPDDVIPDMQQPINPNLAHINQVPSDAIPDMQQPIVLKLIEDPAELDDLLINEGYFHQLADIPGFVSVGVGGPDDTRNWSQAALTFEGTPNAESLSQADTVMQGIPYVLNLTSDGLDSLLNDASQGTSLRDQIMDIPGVTDIVFQTNFFGTAKPVVFHKGRLSEDAETQLASIMGNAHLDFETDLALSFY